MILKNIAAVVFPALLGAALSWLLNTYTGIAAAHWHYSLLSLAGLCLALNVLYAARAASSDFSQLLLVGIVVKLLFALVLIFLYSLKQPAGFYGFSIHFILHYVLFTIFEIRYLLQLIKQNKSPNP